MQHIEDPQEGQAPGEELTDREEGGPTSPAEEPEEDVTGGATGRRESPFEPDDPTEGSEDQ